jgi:hypothetical protein
MIMSPEWELGYPLTPQNTKLNNQITVRKQYVSKNTLQKKMQQYCARTFFHLLPHAKVGSNQSWKLCSYNVRFADHFILYMTAKPVSAHSCEPTEFKYNGAWIPIQSQTRVQIRYLARSEGSLKLMWFHISSRKGRPVWFQHDSIGRRVKVGVFPGSQSLVCCCRD